MAAMPWRCTGHCARFMACNQRGVLDRLRRRLGGWAFLHRLRAIALGCTTVMYEGKPVGTPDAGRFWRVIEEHRVRVFFTAPTAFRAIKREDPNGALIRSRDLGHFRALFLAGERADPPTVAWAEDSCAPPSLTIGGRPRPAGRSPRTAWASSDCRSSTGRRRAPCRAGTFACSTPKPGFGPKLRPATSARWRLSCRCHPAR